MLARHLYEFGYAIRGSTYRGKLSSTPSRNEVPVYHMQGGGRDAFIARTLIPRRPAHATVGLDSDDRARESLDISFQGALRPTPRPASVAALPSARRSAVQRARDVYAHSRTAPPRQAQQSSMRRLANLTPVREGEWREGKRRRVLSACAARSRKRAQGLNSDAAWEQAVSRVESCCRQQQTEGASWRRTIRRQEQRERHERDLHTLAEEQIRLKGRLAQLGKQRRSRTDRSRGQQ